MIISDAAHILELSGEVNKSDIRHAYGVAARKYHPDRNPAGEEMMKLVNEAWDTLRDFSGNLDDNGVNHEGAGYGDAVNDALNAIISIPGLDIEVCGSWIWVSGDTYPNREALSNADFIYASKKKRWYFRPDDWKSRSRGAFSMDEIRDKFGTSSPKRSTPAKLSSSA